MTEKNLSQEGVFTVLNPVAEEVQKEMKGLNPRLDTLSGKTVKVINMGGGNEKVVESIAYDLMEAVPECNVEYHKTEGGMSAGPLTENDWKGIMDSDAVVIGHAY